LVRTPGVRKPGSWPKKRAISGGLEFEPRPVTAPASQGLGLSDAEAGERVQLGDEGYPLITAQNAAAAVERNELKRGRG